MKSLPYREGSFFAIPLRRGGYAAGVVARMAPRGKILLVYLFGTRYSGMPTLANVVALRSTDAIKCLFVGDLGLMSGEWPVLGDAPSWTRKDWPMPIFVRRDDLSRQAWRVYYDDADPSRLEREELASYDETAGLESSGLYGYGAVEILLTKLLTS